MPKKLLIEFNGKIACLSEHCRDLGVNVNTVRSRHEKTGEPYDKCLEYYLEIGVNSPVNHPKDSRLFNIWHCMMQRCFNKKHKMYKYYGGRGITVCERWLKYEYFEEDMYNAYLWHVNKYGEKDTTLDRIKNNRNYMENNCRWATRREQLLNRGSIKNSGCEIILDTGETLAEASNRTGISLHTLYGRYYSGWSTEEILNTPIKTKTNTKYYLPCKNNTVLLLEHCKQNDYKLNNIMYYIKQYNLSPDKALARYLEKKKKEIN